MRTIFLLATSLIAGHAQATKIPPAYAQAAKALLGRGLSDPSGGTFSRAVVRMETRDGEREAYGWVLPKGKQIVAVDGLTYPVVKVIGAAKISDLIRNQGFHYIEGYRFPNIQLSEVAEPLLTETIVLPALLLARGEPILAESFYKRQAGGYEAVNLYRHLLDRYTLQAANGLGNRKYKAAIPWAEKLAIVEAVRIQQKVDYPEQYSRFDTETPRVLAPDLKRRVANPKKPFDRSMLLGLNQNQRVELLIDYLDEVGAAQMSFPGSIMWEDPILAAMSEQGEAIVPALIDAVRSDNRLSRSISMHRPHLPGRSIYSVQFVARKGLERIWPSSAAVSGNGRLELSANLKAAWAKTSDRSEPERWLAVLQDENAGRENWLRAAKELTMPANRVTIGGGWTTTGPATDKLKGEPIRRTHGHQISEILATRARQIATAKNRPTNSLDIHYFAQGLEIAHCLAKWDANAAKPTLEAVTTEAIKFSADLNPESYYLPTYLGPAFSIVIADRLASGSETAGSDYQTWIRGLMSKMERDGFIFTAWDIPLAALMPLWTNPTDPSLHAIAEVIYGKLAQNLIGSDEKLRGRTLRSVSDLARDTRLLTTPAFRKFLAEALSIEVFAGRILFITEPEGVRIERNNGAWNSGGRLPKDYDLSKFPERETWFTVSDEIADTIAGLKGAPAFSSAWKPELKQAARAKVRDWLLDPKTDWDSVVKELNVSTYLD